MIRRSPLVFLALLFATSLLRVAEPDTPWYLRTGSLLLDQRALPRIDPLSFTSQQPWLNHEWLSEVLLALTYRAGGFLGLALLQAALLVATLALLMGARPPRGMALLAGVAGGLILRETIALRAQLFSNLLFAATLALALQADGDPRRERRLIWTLPVGLLWTQLHGGNPFPIVLLLLLWLARPSRGRALITLLAAIASCLGPYGWHVHKHFLQARSTLPEIVEWHPLTSALAPGAPLAWGFLGLVLAAAAALLVRRRHGENVRFEALALLCFVLGAVRYVRFVQEATLVASAALAPALAAWRRPAWQSLAAALGLVGLAALASERRWGIGFDPARFPIAAVDYLRRTHPPGPLFNSYNFGGYLLFAYPEERVFVDGRAFTVYSEAHLRELIDVYAQPERFARMEERYGLRLALVKRSGRGAGLVEYLRRRSDWALTYEDRLALVFEKRAPGFPTDRVTRP